MTIQFVPGDPNRSKYSLDQAQWKNHRIIAYGSGNNLIIYSITDNGNPSLQTVYLDKDPVAVCVNGDNGLICISCGDQILILKPVNEFMSVPKWSEALKLDVDGTSVLCMKWALSEDELAIGTSDGLHLCHLFVECGEIVSSMRWSQQQASAVEGIDITADASKIVTYNLSNFDSFAKVFVRMNYGDATLFELIYLDHDREKWLQSFKWREKQQYDDSDSSEMLASMANIKNIRSYMPVSSENNDILYTITNDHMLNVWATYDFGGHSHLKLWASFDISMELRSDFIGALIVENVKLQSTLLATLAAFQGESKITKYFSDKNLANFDLVISVGKAGSVVYAIWNIESNPPNNVQFEKICETDFNRASIPHYLMEAFIQADNAASSDSFQLSVSPISLSNTMVLKGTNKITYLLHDRIKNTIRLMEGSFNGLVEFPQGFDLVLRNKFQGHEKSIRKLVTSSSSYRNNIMLSISNFPQHNYIWEPLLLDPQKQKSMSITKRFRLNVTRDPDGDIHRQGILDAILINDVTSPNGTLRHHIAVVIEHDGYLSLWDCNGVTMDDKDAELISRTEILDSEQDRIRDVPRAFFLKRISDSSYVVICAYDAARIKAWKIDVDLAGKVSYKGIKTDVLPGKYTGNVKLSAVDTYLEKDLSIIDEKGLFRLIGVSFNSGKECAEWHEITLIHTNIERASYIRGASVINKLAIVDESGTKLTVWDTKSGHLEFEESFPDNYGKVTDLDWTFIGSMGSTAYAILSVGFSRFVLLYTQLRYDYTNLVPTFAVLKKIDISDYTPHEIGDLIWLDEGYLVIGSGNQFFIDDKWVQIGELHGSSANRSIDSTIRQLMVGYDPNQSSFLISDLVRILNGPLPVYHPQFLIQALLTNEFKMVEEILVRLLKVLRKDGEIKWDLGLDFMDVIFQGRTDRKRRRVSFTAVSTEIDIFNEFNATVVDLLVEKLTKVSLPLLTRHQQTTLINVTNIMSSISKYDGSLDENGLKFLLGFELFQSSLKQSRLSMRDTSWALHSDQKEMLFSIIDNAYQHRLSWETVRKVGLAYWVDKHRLTTLVEGIARNEFGDSRDPSGRVSVLYLAIKKKQVLVGLWRTVYHPEKDKVLKFLSNNFSEERWRSAALKNAFVLLGKHRYMDAAYFFLLAGQVKDCCITLCNKLDDTELALVVAKVNSDKETVMHIIENFILPKALIKGDRWMTSWAFWEMKQKEISIQALVMSPITVVRQNVSAFSENFQKYMSSVVLKAQSKSFLKDDPVLAVLFQNLRASKLNYLQGSRAVQPEEEFEFVVKVSTIYSRMGCDFLALLLMKNWKFLDPSPEKEESSENKDIFLEFSAAPKESKIAPASSTFQEPDMSAFSFGF